MKRESKKRAGGAQGPTSEQPGSNDVRGAENFSSKGWGMTREEHEADREAVEREDAERLKAMGLKATPNGIVPIDEREAGREAAYEELVEKELCFDLAGKCARESANRTGDAIADVRDRYEAIVIELLAARYTQTDGNSYALATALRGKYESDSALEEFLPNFSKWIAKYVSDCINEHTFAFTPLYRQIVPAHTWTLRDHSVSKELLTALAEEYVRDREGLLRFLYAVFRRWRKIGHPHSAWRVKLVTEQHANNVAHHRIAQRLEKIDAVPKGSAVPGTSAYRKLRSRIKKIRSRDQNAAGQRRVGDRNG